MTILILLCCVGIISADSSGQLEDIPFETAKILHHKQHICMFRPENPRCYGSEKIPGDPEEVAHLYKVQKSFQNNIKKLKPIAPERRNIRDYLEQILSNKGMEG